MTKNVIKLQACDDREVCGAVIDENTAFQA